MGFLIKLATYCSFGIIKAGKQHASQSPALSENGFDKMIHTPTPDLPLRTPSGTFQGPIVVPPPIRSGLGERRSTSGSDSHQALGQVTLSRPSLTVALDKESDSRLSTALESVVKVLVTFNDPDYANPWQSKGAASSIGSGVAIRTESAGLKILSAAHVVANQTFVQVGLVGDPEKYVAHVHAICNDCDLALLSVDSTVFWKSVKPISLASDPPLRSLVLVAGFPVGGNELSVTEGVVSRIESQKYSHSGRELLAATVDAAMNPGNSGGPAFNNKGQLIGIAFQSLTGTETENFQISIQTIGHIIVPSVIRVFLGGVSRFGPQDFLGFPSPGIRYQPLTNPYLRKLFKLQDDVSGVLVTSVWHGGTCHKVLQAKDIITHVANKKVSNDGTIALDGRYGRINMVAEFTMHHCGDEIPLRIIRGGKPQVVKVSLLPATYIAPKEYDKDPRYFIWCGLVFQPLTVDYLQQVEDPSAYLVHLMQSDCSSESEREVVVFSRILSDSVNVGYEETTQRRIRSVNGETIRSFQDFVEKVQKSTDRQLVDIETWEGSVIVIPGPKHPEAAAANERILKHYRVANDRNMNQRCLLYENVEL